MVKNAKLVISLSIKTVGFSHIYIYKMKIFPGFQYDGHFTGRFSQSTIHLFLVKVEMFCSEMKIELHFPHGASFRSIIHKKQ